MTIQQALNCAQTTKTFRGIRTDTGTTVTVDGMALDLRLDLRNHSPSGFEWGYLGSGPAQLALAICANVVEDDVGRAIYQSFKRQVVAQLTDEWELTDADVRKYVEEMPESERVEELERIQLLKELDW